MSGIGAVVLGGFIDVLTDVMPGDNPALQGARDVFETIDDLFQAVANGNPVMQEVAGLCGVPSGVMDFAQQHVPVTSDQEGPSTFDGGLMGTVGQIPGLPQTVQMHCAISTR